MQSVRPHSLAGLAMASILFAATQPGCDQKTATEAATPDKPAVQEPVAEPTPPPPAETAAPEEKATDESRKDTPDSQPNKPAGANEKVEAPKTAVLKAGAKAEAPKESDVNKGEDVAAPSFATWLQSSGSYEAGKQGTVTAVLVAKDPYKCNAKYPYKFKVSPSPDVTYPEATVRGMQISPKRSTMTIPFVPTKAGKATVSGELSFSICTDERCVIEKRNLSVTVDVK